MAESENQANIRSNKNKHYSLSLLMECISTKATAQAKEIMSEMTAKDLDMLSVLDESYMTPLHYAVKNQNTDIVKMLLVKGVNVERGEGCYSNFYGYFIWKETPLLHAVINSHTTLIDMLLEYGANPQFDETLSKTMDPMNGRQYGNYPINIPFNVALHRGKVIFQKALNCSDVTKEYGSGSHTCLCYAVKHYLEVSCSTMTQEYLKMIIRKGGTLCNGNCNNFAEEAGVISSDGICSILIKCLHTIIRNELDSIHGFHCTSSRAAFKCLGLICTTDYVRTNSCIYRTFQRFCESLHNPAVNDDDGIVADLEENEYITERTKKNLNWIKEYTNHPSPLKQIARVMTKRYIPNVSSSKCNSLPIPADLRAYLNVETVEQ